MSELDNILKDINKTYKDNIAFKGLERKDFDRIPFSSPRLNYMTYGGIARHTITEFFGAESSGKTSTALDVVKNAQAILPKGKHIVYIDIENLLDEKWAEQLGVNIKDLILIRPQQQTAEQIFDISEKVICSGEAWLVILDSVGAMISGAIFEESYEKKSYGGIATPMTRFVNKIVSMLRKYDSTLLILNQVREDMDNPYNQFITPGGRALKHEASLRLFFRQGKYIDKDGNELSNKAENPAGHKIEVSMIKSKICRNDRRLGFYTLNYLNGVDWLTDLIEVAIKYEIVSQSGAWFSVFDENGEQIDKFQGKAKLIDKIKNDTQFKDKIMNLVNKCMYDEE